MGKDSSIEWTHHTFNPWWGCTKVSSGCSGCYASTFATRMGLQIWGDDVQRRFFGEKHWNDPLRWNRSAERRNVRERVFCGSMMDWLEDRPELIEPRARLMKLIGSTPFLNWLLLTKRPENARLIPWDEAWPVNAWMGVSVEDQKTADERIPHLIRIPAVVRFVSFEPALGSVDFERAQCTCAWPEDAQRTRHNLACPADRRRPGDQRRWSIDWLVVGGESGPNARPFEVEWARQTVQQCKAVGVPCFVKQDSGRVPGKQGRIPNDLWIKEYPA